MIDLRCPKCKARHQAGQSVCMRCGETLPGPYASTIPEGQAIVVREYQGKLLEATRLFQRDAERMAARGYYPTSQVYQPGSWGAGAFLVALVLFVVLIGILVFLYMLIVKPPGTLVVTYQWRAGDERSARNLR